MEQQYFNNAALSVPRTFASGSRGTPDVSDQFLEKQGFYRKHTAKDSSSLFRVVSEHENGVQLYHENVRRYCVTFMRTNFEIFGQQVDGDFLFYLENMSLTTTAGSMMELKALAMFYDANVVIFEPFTCGRWFYQGSSSEKTWHVFLGREKHFDSVFRIDYMHQAAFCQALVHEVLYKNVFRLPDVDYAVERMLHDPLGITTRIKQDAHGRTVAITADGRTLMLSKREDTQCVLSNHLLCHFHNNENFPYIERFFERYPNEVRYRTCGGFSGPDLLDRFRNADPLLHYRTVSCVRQLLNDGITPFPYKAAKSLDPNIYRNSEYDSWNETIRAARTAKQNENVFRPGMKCIGWIEGIYRICRIDYIFPDKQHCMVRLNNGHTKMLMRLESLKPFGARHPFQGNDGGNQHYNIGEPVGTFTPAQLPMVENPPNHLDDEQQQIPIQTMTAQNEITNWPQGTTMRPEVDQQPPLFDVARIPSSNVIYGYPLVTALPVPSSTIPFADVHAQQMMQQFPATMMEQHHQHHQMQHLPMQQQQMPHLPMQQQPPQQDQLQQQQFWYQQNNRPMFEMLLPEDSSRQCLNQSPLVYEPIPYAVPAHYAPGVLHYVLNLADPANPLCVCPKESVDPRLGHN